MTSDSLVDLVVNLIFEKKGRAVKSLDLRTVTTMTDYFVICTADSDLHAKAIADHIDDGLREEGIKVTHKEGMNTLNWVLIDLFDVVIHIFREETRNFYNIEKLWGDAPAKEHQDTEA